MLIKLCSADRISGTSSHNAVIEFPSYTFTGSYELVEAFVPISYYNVNSRNNVIRLFDNGSAKTATITAGFYTSSTLTAAVKTALDAASGGFQTYTVSIDSTTMKLTVTAGAAFQFLFGTVSTSSAASVLGFSDSDTSAATSQTSDNIINLNPVLSFNINIEGEGDILTAAGNQQTFTVAITGNSQSYVQYTPDPGAISVTFRTPKKTLRVKVQDDNGQLLDLNGADYYVLLREMK